MLVARIPSQLAQNAIQELLEKGLMDRRMKIQRSKNEVFIPIESREIARELKTKYQMHIEELDVRLRSRRGSPFERIKKRLQERGLPKYLLPYLPEKWKLFGDVLILRLPSKLLREKQEEIVGEYAEVLRVKCVLQDMSGIHGRERIPAMRLLWGDDTETVHKENAILYCFDAAKIMFSSGNIDERIKMATINCDGETILDMFAGIGYFSLPMAIHRRPKKIYACEIRKLAFEYLLKNVKLNDVSEVIEPVLGDNRDFKPPAKIDRIIMGYLNDTYLFLPKALSCLKSGGIIHYHENCPNGLLPHRPIENIRKAAGNRWKLEVISTRTVKSFAPGVSHAVIDGRFTSS